MNPARLRTGEKVAGISAVLLFIAMFFDWFGAEVTGSRGLAGVATGAGGSAWEALGLIRFVLVLTVAVALVNAFVRLRDPGYAPALSLNVVVAILGGFSTLLILFRVVVPPPFGDFGGIPVEATLEPGVFFGLLTAAGVACGGYRAMGEEGTTFSSAADRLAGGDSPPPSPRG